MNVHSLDDDERRLVLGEILMDELRAIREFVQDIPQIKKDIAELKERMTTVESDIKVIKAVLIEHTRELKEHRLAIRDLQLKTAHL